MKGRPSIAVSSLPLWKLYIFPLIIAPTVPSVAPPAPLVLAAHGLRGSLPCSPLGLFFPLPSLHKTSWGRVWRGAGWGGGNGILDGLGKEGLPASTFAALE